MDHVLNDVLMSLYLSVIIILCFYMRLFLLSGDTCKASGVTVMICVTYSNGSEKHLYVMCTRKHIYRHKVR